jgi:hypothetical protein
MYCPNCRYEYREGFTTCSDCGVELVSELPPEEPVEHPELETVMTVTDLATLSAAKAALESAGIEFLADGEETQDVFGGMGGEFAPLAGFVQIEVPKEAAEEARRILSDLTVPPSELDGDAEEEDDTETEGE